MKELKGIALSNWKMKWVRIVNDMMKIYGVDDYAILGFSDPYDPDEVMRWLLERCHGLTESECIDKIADELKSMGDKRELDEALETYMSELERWEREEKKFKQVASLLGIPADLPPQVIDQLLQIIENPELDSGIIYSIIKKELEELGWPEGEAERLARKSAEVIDNLLRKKRERATTVAHWTQVLRVDRRRRDSRRRRQEKALMRLLKRWMQTTRVFNTIMSLREMELAGLAKVKMAKSANIEEAVNKLRTVYNAEEAEILLPTTIYTFTNRLILCRVRYDPTIRRGIIEKCEKPILLVEQERGQVYYKIIEGEK